MSNKPFHYKGGVVLEKDKEYLSANTLQTDAPNPHHHVETGFIGNVGSSLSRIIQTVTLQTRVVNPDAEQHYQELTRATDGSAGFDLRACIDDSLTLEPGDCQLIGSGLAIWLENPNLVGCLVPRSGLGHKHGIVVGNLTGVIDSDYQGELFISCWNRSKKTYTVDPGEKIAQLIIQPVYPLTLNVVESFGETTERGDGGFGHTGRF